MTESSIGPKSAFQEKYLNSNARIILAGGAAGSSKSYLGLMRHLRWADDRPIVTGKQIGRAHV